MAEPAILIRVRPGLYRAHSRTTPGLTYKINVALLKRWGWSAVCDCPGSISIHNRPCKHAKEATQKEYRHMVQQQEETGIVVFQRLPVPELDPGQTMVSAILPAPAEIVAMGHIANLMTPDNEDPREAFKKILAGWELGVGPLTAIRRMFTVNGKIEPDAQLMLALAIEGDPDLRVDARGDANKCTVTLKRNGVAREAITYTIDDANCSGQTKKKRRWNKWFKNDAGKQVGRWEEIDGPWQLYPADMLKHAAVKRALRLYAPDLINNVKGARRLGNAEAMMIDDGRESIDAIAIESAHSDPPGDAIEVVATRAEPVQSAPDLNDALDQHDDHVEQAQEKLDPSDTTNYREVVKALVAEMIETTDEEFQKAFMDEMVSGHKSAIVFVRNVPKLNEAKLSQSEARDIALSLRARMYGAGPEATPPVEVGAE